MPVTVRVRPCHPAARSFLQQCACRAEARTTLLGKRIKTRQPRNPVPSGLWVRYLRGERKAEGNRAEAPGSLLQVTRMPDQAPSRLNQRFGETRARFRRGFGHVFLNQLTRSCFMSASISRYVPYTHGDSPPLISGTDCGLGGNAAPPACVLCKAWPAVLSCLGTQAALWPQAAGGPFKWQNRQQKAQKCEKRGNKETVKRTLVYSRSCKEKAEHRLVQPRRVTMGVGKPTASPPCACP